MELLDSTPVRISGGRYAFKTDVTSGTVDLQWSLDGVGFTTVTDGQFTSDADGIVDFPSVYIQAVISGTATFNIGRLPYAG